jgi:hypothetical protein
MKTRLFASLSMLCGLATTAWLGLLIIENLRRGPVETFKQALAYATRQEALFTITYLNAAFITLLATALMACLYLYCRAEAPEWSLMGLVFVPNYATINLFVYLSQITLVHALATLQQTAELQAVALTMLRLTIQAWEGSATAYFNLVAYALLGIPSIIYGILLIRHGLYLKIAGGFLALSGVASLLALAGASLHIDFLSGLSIVSGGLFLICLAPLTIGFWRAPLQASQL